MRIGSMARCVKKTVKDESQGTKPSEANPTATPTKFCSAIPICRNLPGYAIANLSALVEFAKSASKTTTFGSLEPRETSVSPNTSRNAFILLPPQCQVPPPQFSAPLLRKVVPVDLDAAPAKLLEYASQINSRPRIATIAAMLFINR